MYTLIIEKHQIKFNSYKAARAAANRMLKIGICCELLYNGRTARR